MCSKKPQVVSIPTPTAENVFNVLPLCYEQKVVPLEKRHLYDQFYNPPITRAEFKASPMVLFLGQYSVGKTTMIKYLVGDEYPGSRIGPEPTTDCFTIVHYAEKQHVTMGTTLAADANMPFQSLNVFGSAFLTRLRGAAMDSPLLKHMVLIDTPGILSGQKQLISREYDFASVTRFIADKVDMIILLFDTSKLDISDEYKMVLQGLKGNEEKIRIVLNKADMVGPGELIRVRGALMWSLSKIIETPEVPKVYIGSFSDKVKQEGVLQLFKDDYVELFKDLEKLACMSMTRKLNDVIKRAKQVKIHAMLMTQLISHTTFFKKTDVGLKKLLTEENLRVAFHEVQNRERINESDLPPLRYYQTKGLQSYPKGWNKLDPKQLERLNDFINNDVTKIVAVIPHIESAPSTLRKAVTSLMGKCKSRSKSGDGDKKDDNKNEEKDDKEKEKTKEKSKEKTGTKRKSAEGGEKEKSS